MNNYLKLSPICLAVTLMACSETRKLDTMRDSTVEMRDTTKELLQVSKEMNETTKSLSKTSEEMNKTTKTVARTSDEMNATTKGVAKTSEEMNATTKGVAKTSEEMRDRMATMQETTNEMKGLTEGLSQQSAEIYDASRQAMAAKSRLDLLAAVAEAESGARKAVLAALYFKAFEFHLWTGANKDAAEGRRAALMTEAVKEFFKSVQEFAADDTPDPDPIAKQNPHHSLHEAKNKDATFNALALTLHEANSKQEDMLLEHKELQLVTMYSLIVDALAAEKQQGGGELPLHQQVVLENKELAVKLLQARHNILLAVFLKDTLKRTISPINQTAPEKPSFVGSLKGLFKKMIEKGKAAANVYVQPKTTGNPYIWEMNLDQYNPQQTRLLTRYLRGCLQTRKDLAERIGVMPVVHPHVETIFKGLKVVGGAKDGVEILQAQVALRETIDQARAPLAPPQAAAPAVTPNPGEVPAPETEKESH